MKGKIVTSKTVTGPEERLSIGWNVPYFVTHGPLLGRELKTSEFHLILEQECSRYPR